MVRFIINPSITRYMRLRNIVMWLAGINIAAFLLQMMLGDWFTTTFWLESDFLFRPWILITHMFLHGSIGHILFNMYALVMFGGLLEQQIGSKRFLMLYLGAGLLAGILHGMTLQGFQSALGASGAIMGIMGTLVVLMPNLRLLLFFAIPMPFWVAAIGWTLIDLAGLFAQNSGIGHLAHLVGLAVGLAYGFYLIKRFKKRPFSTSTNWSQSDVDNYIKYS
jgi:membrane associated rhomboid family serine protease